jgi:SAM-dependent methyltransferase
MNTYKLTPRRVSCPICFSNRSNLLYSVESGQAAQHFVLKEVNEKRFSDLKSYIEMLWQGGACDVVRCSNCGFCFAVPYIAGDARFYSLAYDRADYPSWKWEYQLTYETLQAMAQRREQKSIMLLEIGAGNGAFIKRVAPALTPKECVLCTEYSDYGKAEISRYGITCLSEDIRSMRTEELESQFDAICMFQVLEHMDGLDDLFGQLTMLARANGSLFVAVPNGRRIEFNELNGALLDMPPNHIGRWNKKCFEVMARRHGWAVIRHQVDRTKVSRPKQPSLLPTAISASGRNRVPSQAGSNGFQIATCVGA